MNVESIRRERTRVEAVMAYREAWDRAIVAAAIVDLEAFHSLEKLRSALAEFEEILSPGEFHAILRVDEARKQFEQEFLFEENN